MQVRTYQDNSKYWEIKINEKLNWYDLLQSNRKLRRVFNQSYIILVWFK